MSRVQIRFRKVFGGRGIRCLADVVLMVVYFGVMWWIFKWLTKEPKDENDPAAGGDSKWTKWALKWLDRHLKRGQKWALELLDRRLKWGKGTKWAMKMLGRHIGMMLLANIIIGLFSWALPYHNAKKDTVPDYSKQFQVLHTLLGTFLGFLIGYWVNNAYANYSNGTRYFYEVCDLVREIILKLKSAKLVGEKKTEIRDALEEAFEVNPKKDRKSAMEDSIMKLENSLIGTDIRRAQDIVNDLRKASRSMVGVCSTYTENGDDAQYTLHTASILEKILFSFIYSMPLIYWPYESLRRCILGKWTDQDVMALIGSFSIMCFLAAAYFVFFRMAQNLSSVYGKKMFQWDVDGCWIGGQPLYKFEPTETRGIEGKSDVENKSTATKGSDTNA